MAATDRKVQGSPPSQPINIAQSRTGRTPMYGSLQDIFRSPDQMSSGETSQPSSRRPRPHPTFLPDSVDNEDTPRPLRPTFPHGTSTPFTQSPLRGRASSNATDTRSIMSRIPSRRQQEREWSVFSELVTNDREFPISSSVPKPSGALLDIVGPTTPRLTSGPIRILSPSEDLSQLPNTSTPGEEPLEDDYFQNGNISSERASTSEPLDSDSDSTHSSHTVMQDEPPRRWYSLSIPTLTPLQRNILKCSIAYFIGSLFTFSPYLSGFIADITGDEPGDRTPNPSAHMISTVTVYFNPAKTFGAMLEADVFCFMGVLFASFVSLSSMGMYWFFELQPGWEWLADSLVILWVGLGMTCVAWMKMWMSKPTFNTACSMTTIIISVVVVKEGGLDTLLQVSLIVLIGSICSNLICYIFWPQRATENLQSTMTKTLDSFNTLLKMITNTFLLEEPLHPVSHEKLQKAAESHQNSFTALKKNLNEAQSERIFGGPSRSDPDHPSRNHLGQAYEDAVGSLNRLGQHLNGLRSGISVQFDLIKASRDGRLTLRKGSKNQAFMSGAGNGKGKVQAQEIDESALLQAAADAFGDLIDDLGPPLKALSTTCSTSLKRLREAFSQLSNLPSSGHPLKSDTFHKLAGQLERALFTFESTSNQAVLRLYRSGYSSAEQSINSLTDDNPVLSGNESESIFLVYFFFFTMQEFTRELICLVDAIGRIYSIQRINSERNGLWNRFPRLVNWMRTRLGPTHLQKASEKGMRRRWSAYFLPAHRSVSFPKVTPHAPNTKQTPGRADLSYWGRFKQSVWALGARLREPDMKYAFKVGMAMAVLAAPAFFDQTRPVFTKYKGEWALISFFVVISPTIGATNYLGLHRTLGTLLGAFTAVAVWSLFPENPYVLSVFGFFFSMPCFYLIVATPEYATSGRFVLLTYNLTCLYCYNSRETDIPVVDIAIQRASAVTVGVVWAAIVSRYWWPIEARRQLSKALGEFCLNIGWLYTRLVAFNSFEDGTGVPIGAVESSNSGAATPTELTSLLLQSKNQHINQSIMEFMAMELHLQIQLIELQGLLKQTQHEPRLKGPFPIKLYRSMLTSLQTILDKLHSMRCVTAREEWHTTVHQDFIVPVNKERREMVGNVILYFSTLAAAFRLKSPLPPYLPPAEPARLRLVEAIRKLDVVKNREVKGSRQLLFFAYSLTMRGVIQELDYLGHTLQDTFGVIGDSIEAFERLFIDTAHETP